MGFLVAAEMLSSPLLPNTETSLDKAAEIQQLPDIQPQRQQRRQGQPAEIMSTP